MTTQDFKSLKSAADHGDRDAQFQLARLHAGQREYPRARRWFSRAAKGGHAQAATELGVLALYGLGQPADPLLAIQAFEQAAALGSREADYQLALIRLGNRALNFDASQSLEQIARAAHARFPPALRALGMAWARAGDMPAACQCLHAAATEGDAASSRLLEFFPASEAREAAHLPGAPPLDCLQDEELPLHIHHPRPQVATAEHVFSELECAYVRILASDRLEPSHVVDPRSGQSLRHPTRSSSSMAFAQFDEHFWLRALQRRLAHLGRLPFCHAEPLSVLRYTRGQEYRPHRDYLNPQTRPREFESRAPGQRVRTIFCFLSDVEQGGGTDFPELGVSIEPRLGRIVMFDNLSEDGTPDPDTLHAGLPVQVGEKWLATLWLRERPMRKY